ncbi:MAG: cytochrome c4 [Betaproteobacteria bacterium]
MHRIPAVLALVLAAFAAAPVRGADASNREVPDSLEQRVAACAACHGKKGEGLKANEYYPRIAGKPAGYLYNQLVNFRERRRHSPVMNHMVAYLSDGYLREIAQYYAELPPTFPPASPAPAGAALARGEALMTRGDAARKIPACIACHGKALTGMNPAIPALVGLDSQYVAAQMGAWRNRTRRAKAPDCMAEIATLLVPGDISALAAWLSVQSPSAQGAAPLAPGSLVLPLQCGGIDGR